MHHGLSDAAVAQIQTVLSRHREVEKAILYGSRAKGNFRTGSDVDLALVGQLLTPVTVAQIHDEFEAGSLPHRVDVALLSEIKNAALIDHIQRVGQVFYESA